MARSPQEILEPKQTVIPHDVEKFLKTSASAGFHGIIFDYYLEALEAESLPQLFALAENGQIEDSILQNSVLSYCIKLAEKIEKGKKDPKETKEEEEQSQDQFAAYYREAVQATKSDGTPLTEEEQQRVSRYSEYLCLYLTSKDVKELSKASKINILTLLQQFSLKNMEAFFKAERHYTGFGPLAKHQTLRLFYSKGITHDFLLNSMPIHDRHTAFHEPFYFEIDKWSGLQEATGDQLRFLIRAPMKHVRAVPMPLEGHTLGCNDKFKEYLGGLVALLNSNCLTLKDIGSIPRYLTQEIIERLKTEKETFQEIQKEIETIKGLSLYQQALLQRNDVNPQEVPKYTDEQAFILLHVLQHGVDEEHLINPRTKGLLQKLELKLEKIQYRRSDEYSYTLRNPSSLLECLSQGILPKYFNANNQAISLCVETVHMALQSGLNPAQAQHPKLFRVYEPEFGKTLLQVLKGGEYAFNDLIDMPFKILKAIDAGIPARIYQDKDFHEKYITYLQKGYNWQQLKKVPILNLAFLALNTSLEVDIDDIRASQAYEDIMALSLQAKISQLRLPIEIVAALSYAQLSFIYSPRLSFIYSRLDPFGPIAYSEKPIYSSSSCFDRYKIAIECSDFDLKLMVRLNIDLDTLREHPYLRTEHIHAYEEGLPKAQVLRCRTIDSLEVLRTSCARQKPSKANLALCRSFAQAWSQENSTNGSSEKKEGRESEAREEALSVSSSSSSSFLTQYEAASSSLASSSSQVVVCALTSVSSEESPDASEQIKQTKRKKKNKKKKGKKPTT